MLRWIAKGRDSIADVVLSSQAKDTLQNCKTETSFKQTVTRGDSFLSEFSLRMLKMLNSIAVGL